RALGLGRAGYRDPATPAGGRASPDFLRQRERTVRAWVMAPPPPSGRGVTQRAAFGLSTSSSLPLGGGEVGRGGQPSFSPRPQPERPPWKPLRRGGRGRRWRDRGGRGRSSPSPYRHR